MINFYLPLTVGLVCVTGFSIILYLLDKYFHERPESE